MRGSTPSRISVSGDPIAPQPSRKAAGGWRGGLASIGLVLGVGAMLALAMHLPQELADLNHNQERIRALQEENNNLKKRRDERRERLKNLKENFNEQELEIRKNFHLYKPGDTVFILPPKTATESAPADSPQN